MIKATNEINCPRKRGSSKRGLCDLSDEDKTKIYQTNAERVFSLSAG